ncbi:unnamed protein product [Trichobilharzia szidati]|nr:unnamed protein product [Trichobilharzia szidati]
MEGHLSEQINKDVILRFYPAIINDLSSLLDNEQTETVRILKTEDSTRALLKVCYSGFLCDFVDSLL